MADHGSAVRRTRPVLAAAVVAHRERGTVGLRSRQYVVAVRRIAAAVDDLALLGERGLLGEVIAAGAQLGDVLGNPDTPGIFPRPLADAIARVHGSRTAGRLGREIGAPRLRGAEAPSLRQRLAVIVGPRHTPAVPPCSHPRPL